MSKPLKALSESQMQLLCDKIRQSNDATPLAKQVVLWMLKQTQGMTKPVALGFPGILHKIGCQTAIGVHDMNSCNGGTFLHEFLKKMNTTLFFSSYGGIFLHASGKQQKSRKAYIILISNQWCLSGKETILKYDPEAIAAIKV